MTRTVFKETVTFDLLGPMIGHDNVNLPVYPAPIVTGTRVFEFYWEFTKDHEGDTGPGSRATIYQLLQLKAVELVKAMIVGKVSLPDANGKFQCWGFVYRMNSAVRGEDCEVRIKSMSADEEFPRVSVPDGESVYEFASVGVTKRATRQIERKRKRAKRFQNWNSESL